MSRSGYSDDHDQWSLIRWRGAVASAISGKRGQAFLQEMLEALDAMPNKRLVAGELQVGGEVCALGAVAMKRGLDVSSIDPEDYCTVAPIFGISEALAREIVDLNDDVFAWQDGATPETRWQEMRAWVVRMIRADKP